MTEYPHATKTCYHGSGPLSAKFQCSDGLRLATSAVSSHHGHYPSIHRLLRCPAGNPMLALKLDPSVLRRLARDLASLADALDAGAAPATLDHEPDPKSWYLRRVQWLVATGQRASRKDDELAFAAAGFTVTRENIRTLRREFVPPEWSKPGRPRHEKLRRQIRQI